MRFQVVTIFPELIEAFAAVGLIARAIETGTLAIEALSPRRFATDKHGSVDDAPYGGGSGMVMLVEPLAAAMEALDAEGEKAGAGPAHRVLLTPQGVPFDQRSAQRLAARASVMLVCGRYEGIDERVCGLVHEQLSLGDFVLNGGEVAAMAVIETVSRLLPGMLGNTGSLTEESYVGGLLEYPHYTRPRSFRGQEVPPCCSRAITRRLRASGASRRSCVRARCARTCSRRSRSVKKTARCSTKRRTTGERQE